MSKFLCTLIASLIVLFCNAQNVGIGTTTPTQKLDVAGPVRTTELMVTTGSAYDVLKKTSGDHTAFSKGHGGLGMNYIIAINGLFPPNGGTATGYNDVIIGEVRLFAGNYAPSGFMFCQGQLLPVAGNEALFTIIGTLYGGNGVTNFALPDLRGSVPVSVGTPAAGATWDLGEKVD
jgi:microcystin-dependent protein